MKKIIAITMKQTSNELYKEHLDSIDCRWLEFINYCGLMPLLIPNNIQVAKKLMLKNKVHAILLTGGGDPFVISKEATNRDRVENFLIKYGEKHKTPVIGVCRGMQVLLGRKGSSFKLIPDHVATKHVINIYGKKRIVNSFHNYAPIDVNPSFKIIANTSDGTIEGVANKEFRQLGIMWHPEREEIFMKEDKMLMINFIKGKKW